MTPNPIDIPLTPEEVEAFLANVRVEVEKSVKLAACRQLCLDLHSRYFRPKQGVKKWYKGEAQRELEKLLKTFGDI